MSHTKGKLYAAWRENEKGSCLEMYGAEGETVAQAVWYPVKIGNSTEANREANAHRLVACWNACEKFSTDDIRKFDIQDLIDEKRGRAEAEEQCDELADALRSIIDWFYCDESQTTTIFELNVKARELLAKHKMKTK